MIKINMQMPECCDACPMLNDDGDYPMCRVTNTSRGYDFPTMEKRMDDCPLRSEDFQEIRTARIVDTRLTMADHGCLTFYITLEGAGWYASYGGYAIAHGHLGATEFKAENGDGLEAMMRIMDVVGVDRWEDLVGKYVRADATWRNGASVDKIGNIIEDKWYNIRKFFATKAAEADAAKVAKTLTKEKQEPKDEKES